LTDDQPPSHAGQIFERAMEAEGMSDSNTSSSNDPAMRAPIDSPERVQKTEREYISVFDGDTEIKIPKDGKVKLSTKSGENLELSVHDWSTSPWSQRENSRLVEQKNQLQSKVGELVDRFGSLESLLTADPKDIRGKDWATQIIKTVYDLNPSRGDDFREFFESVQQGTLSAQDVKNAELQGENLKLKKGQEVVKQQHSQQDLAKISSNLCNQIIDETGTSSEEFTAKLNKLNADGRIKEVRDPNALKDQAIMVYGEILIDKAHKAITELGLSNDDVLKHKDDIIGLLYANPKQTHTDLARKLGTLIGRPSAKAKEKVSQLRKERTEGLRNVPTPKPNKTPRSIHNKSPFSHLEEKYGDIW
jgi:hypothetical protein